MKQTGASNEERREKQMGRKKQMGKKQMGKKQMGRSSLIDPGR
jgi:hypothetical protein